jgi:hypothetical protein
MTLMRKLALCISNRVIRYASPGCKEWAEGLAREVAFVEGDWAAVGWALGSARILFDYREAPIGSLADLTAAVKKFAESKRSANLAWISTLLWVLISSDKLFRATNWPERIASCLSVAGWVAMMIILFIEWRKRLKVPADDDIADLIQFYAAEMKRGSNFLQSSRLGWINLSSITFYFVSIMLFEKGGVRTHPVLNASLALVWMGVLLLARQKRRTNRRRLEQLDALLAGNHE